MAFILMTLWLAIISHVSADSSTSTCKTPISYPISNVSLSKVSARRGFGLSIGTPPQVLALTLNADFNDTILYTTDGKCTNITTEQCTFTRGGAYDHTRSSTFQVLGNSDGGLATDSSSADGGVNAITLGKDYFHHADSDFNASLNIFIPTSSALPQSALGLGRKSSFIENMYNSLNISSQSWSLFWGLEGATPGQQLDGSLVFGGYDRAKTDGPNMTQPFSSFTDQVACPTSFVLDVTDVRIDFRNGTTSSVVSPVTPGLSPGFRVCIRPDVPLLTLPTDVWDNFGTAIGGIFLAPSESYKLWGMDYSTSGVFGGDLTYVFSSGLQITIYNEQLVVPDVQISDAGATFIPDPSVRELLVYADPISEPDMPLLGQVFMTSAYMHVNNDKQEFTLWQARPTNETDLVAVGSQCTQARQQDPPTLTSAQYVGIATGAVIAMVLCTLGICWYLRRGRSRAASQTLEDTTWNSDAAFNRFSKAELAGSTAKFPGVSKWELDANTTKPLPEIPNWKEAKYGCREVDGQFELPADHFHELSS